VISKLIAWIKNFWHKLFTKQIIVEDKDYHEKKRVGYTHNHSKKSSKIKRLMTRESRKINRKQ